MLGCAGVQPSKGVAEPQVQERRTWARRKGIQAEHQREYDEALVTLKTKVTELEGQDMRETITDKVGRKKHWMSSEGEL